jgi:hypothetical protein
MIWIQDLDFGVGLDVPGAYNAFAARFDIHDLTARTVQPRRDALYGQHDLGYVFADTRQCGKLMRRPVDLYTGDGRSRQ